MNSDAVISIKLSDDEKKLISDNAKKLNMSVSEFIRINSLSSFSKSILLRKENDALQAELKEMKVQLNYYSTIEAYPDSIILPTTREQKEIIRRIYSDFYGEEIGLGDSWEHVVINFLLDDATFPHYHLSDDFKLNKDDLIVQSDGQVYLKESIRMSTWAQIANITVDEISNVFDGVKLMNPID